MQDKKERNRIAVNIFTARLIPVVLAGAVGYATYVIVGPLSVNYLLAKHNDLAAVIPILVIYFLLFILMTASFLRLIHITIWDAPYLPLGVSAERARKTIRGNNKSGSEQGIAPGEYDPGHGTSTETIQPRDDPNSPGLELFYSKEVFTCELDGRPRWCSQCSNWKPDRTHHCSSSGRCILKMDHFCPWVGGPIGENNFKFFVQFNGWTALYCLHLIVVMALNIHKQIINENEEVDPQFCAILGLATFFGLFTAGMTGTSIDLAVNNLTQVERLGSKTKTHVLAVLKPTLEQLLRVNPNHSQVTYPEISYPLRIDHPPSSNPLSRPDSTPQYGVNTVLLQAHKEGDQLTDNSENQFAVHATHTGDSTNIHSNSIKPSPSFTSVSRPGEKSRELPSARDEKAQKTFAVLRMAQGENPWHLGSRLLNFQTLMGTSIFDYLFPIRRSPCCRHEDSESQFAIGPSVDMLKASVFFIETKDIRKGRNWSHSIRNPYLKPETVSKPRGHRRRRRRKSSRIDYANYDYPNASLDAQNPPIQMESVHGNLPRPSTIRESN